MSNSAGFCQTQDRRICRLSFVTVLSVSGIQDVVNNLKCEANPFAVDLDVCEIRFTSVSQVRSDPNGRPNERACFGAMNPLQFVARHAATFTFEIEHLPCNHSAGNPCRSRQSRYG